MCSEMLSNMSPVVTLQCLRIDVNPDDLETIMHTGYKQITLAICGRMPFDAPGTTVYTHLSEGD